MSRSTVLFFYTSYILPKRALTIYYLLLLLLLFIVIIITTIKYGNIVHERILFGTKVRCPPRPVKY